MSHSAVCEVCARHAALQHTESIGGCASAVACCEMGFVFAFDNF